MNMNIKPIIYQVIPRLFGNTTQNCIPNGTIEQNGVGKMNNFTPQVLKSIKKLGITHVWYTGIIEHAHKTDYSKYGIPTDNPHVIKGNAGSPYAIKDYYTLPAKELWKLINFSATYSAEPGLFFIDRANQMATSQAYGQKVVSTNPCGVTYN